MAVLSSSGALVPEIASWINTITFNPVIPPTSSLMSFSSNSPVCGTRARQVNIPALALVTPLIRSPSLSMTYWSPEMQHCWGQKYYTMNSSALKFNVTKDLTNNSKQISYFTFICVVQLNFNTRIKDICQRTYYIKYNKLWLNKPNLELYYCDPFIEILWGHVIYYIQTTLKTGQDGRGYTKET